MKKTGLFALFMIISGATALGPVQAQDDLVYVAVEPCRLADTRKTGVMGKGVSRNFLVSGSNLAAQGGGSCVHPKDGTGVEPLAASVYIVAVPTGSSDGGWLVAFSSDQIPPTSNSVATLNYAKGQVVGNTTIATLCQPGSCPTDGQLGLVSYNSHQHVIVDVQGYFYPQGGAAKGYVVVDINDQVIGGAVGDGEGGMGPLIMSPQGYVAEVGMSNGKLTDRVKLFFTGANCTGTAYVSLDNDDTEIITGGGLSFYTDLSLIGAVSNVWDGYSSDHPLEYWYTQKTPILYEDLPVQSLRLHDKWGTGTVDCHAVSVTIPRAVEAFPNAPAVTGFPNTAFPNPLRYDYR